MNYENIGLKLRNMRIRAGCSVDDVSRILRERGINAAKSTVYSWEQGARKIGADAFLLLCELYEIDDILSEFGYKKKNTISMDTERNILINKTNELNNDGCRAASIYIDGLLTNDRYNGPRSGGKTSFA
jgi:transcriptional regulator with XRE-family HTH domain